VLSTLLLGVLLLPKMSESAKEFGILPHLVIVSSGAGFDTEEAWGQIKDDPLVKMDGDTIYLMSYATSGQLLLFGFELTARLPGTN
jgi:hypothetical protein